MFLGLWLHCNLYLHFSWYFPVCLLLCVCAVDSCFQLYSLPNPLQRSLPQIRSHRHRFQGSGHSHIFLRLLSCHCFCLAPHPLQIASWETHCLKWTLLASVQAAAMVDTGGPTPFGNEWNLGEAQGWEISWHEMGLGCEAARGREINMGKLTNLWWKTSIA